MKYIFSLVIFVFAVVAANTTAEATPVSKPDGPILDYIKAMRAAALEAEWARVKAIVGISSTTTAADTSTTVAGTATNAADTPTTTAGSSASAAGTSTAAAATSTAAAASTTAAAATTTAAKSG